MNCHHPSVNLSSLLAFEKNTSCPGKVSNKLEFSVITSGSLPNTPDYDFMISLLLLVERIVTASLVLGCEILGARLLWNPRFYLHIIIYNLKENKDNIWSSHSPLFADGDKDTKGLLAEAVLKCRFLTPRLISFLFFKYLFETFLP